MSILPKCFVAPETSASTSARREMLQAITWASPPALRMPSATASQASALRLEITTLAPSLASNSAEERPMPRLEPVMTATFPVRSNGVFFTTVLRFFIVRYSVVMAGLVPAIHVFTCGQTWLPGIRPGMTVIVMRRRASPWLHQPAGVGDATQMIIGIPKSVLDHGQPLEVMADLGFLGHADAAMELDRLLTDELCGL